MAKNKVHEIEATDNRSLDQADARDLLTTCQDRVKFLSAVFMTIGGNMGELTEADTNGLVNILNGIGDDIKTASKAI